MSSHKGEGGSNEREKDGKCERNGRGKITGGKVKICVGDNVIYVKTPSKEGTCKEKRYKRKDKGIEVKTAK